MELDAPTLIVFAGVIIMPVIIFQIVRKIKVVQDMKEGKTPNDS
jgi:hypothetical protein